MILTGRRDADPYGIIRRAGACSRRWVLQIPTVLGRAWKVSPAGSVGASAYFRMQRSPPETRTPPLRGLCITVGLCRFCGTTLKVVPYSIKTGFPLLREACFLSAFSFRYSIYCSFCRLHRQYLQPPPCLRQCRAF